MNPIRYAIIGAGEHALRSHAIPGLRVPGLELVALCDPSATQMISFLAQLAVPRIAGQSVNTGAIIGYTHENAVLKDPAIDAVVIASPDRYHTASLANAIAWGKHVLCEKPLATNTKSLESIGLALCQAAALKLVVTSCHPRRFDPPFLWIREHLPRLRAELGAVIGIDFDFSYHRPSGTKGGLHVGLLIDHLNHEYDLMNFLFGFSPVRAHKIMDGQLRYHVAGVREDTIAFTFTGTRLLDAGRYPEFFRIRFERGDLALNCESGEVRFIYHETGRVDTPRAERTDYTKRFVSVMQNFADAIRGDAPNYLTHADLFRNTEIGIALTEGELYSTT